jgi:hypothetical protein
MGMSDSLNAVSGSSAGGMIDPRETHNNPRITIVQRTRFTETPEIASQITRPAVICQCETRRRKILSIAFTKRVGGRGSMRPRDCTPEDRPRRQFRSRMPHILRADKKQVARTVDTRPEKYGAIQRYDFFLTAKALMHSH